MHFSRSLLLLLMALLGVGENQSLGQEAAQPDTRAVSLGYVFTDLFLYNFNFQLEWKPSEEPYSALLFYGSGIRPNLFSPRVVDINKQRLELGVRRYFSSANLSERYFLQASAQWVNGRAYYDDVRQVLVENQNGQRYYADYDFRNRYDFNQYGLNLGVGRRDESKYYFLDLAMSVGYRFKSEYDEDIEEEVNYFGSSGYEGATFRFAATLGLKYDY